VTGNLHRRWFFKPLIALFAIMAMLTVSAASASAEHIHAKAPASQCDICFTLHAVSSEAMAVVQLFHAPTAGERCISGDVIRGYPLPNLRAAVDRGPPSI
jgi:hypothetical protein